MTSLNFSPTQQLRFDDQSIHINLGQPTCDVEEGTKKCHRLSSKIVPDDIPTLTFGSHIQSLFFPTLKKFIKGDTIWIGGIVLYIVSVSIFPIIEKYPST